jgi:hypothetical protein
MPEERLEGGRPVGYGADAEPAARPGVPRERIPPGRGAWWSRPEQQRGVEALSRQGLRAATPAFGTAQPPRGLSGVLRRAAYRIPEHRASRWALLLAGDRLDALEHRLARSAWLVPASVAGAAGYALVARALRRRERRGGGAAQAMRRVIAAMQLWR